ncbi:hypothetical protein [Actinomadura opuntiae]|uniref:hypothetical protein n=1 Tax=Actinomadura sp. OS1-43 TaxID=604315 RepID=UPI00255AC190|nr:hypothetical protein [Actinomadura sp. OS1-43]MDL4820862.1 hypothetical protein [Actinomadura sp. OS1-43]
MPRSRTAPRSVAALAVTGLVLAGCGSSGGDSDAKPSAARTPSSSPSASAAAPQANRTLKFGQPAVMDFAYNDKKGKLQITVTGITKGRAADLSGLDLSGDARKMVPYYIHAVIKNAGTTDLSLTMPDGPRGVLADGGQARSLSVLGRFPKCDGYPDTHSFPPGKSYRTCAPVLAAPGSAVTGATWSSDAYSDEPTATWTR